VFGVLGVEAFGVFFTVFDAGAGTGFSGGVWGACDSVCFPVSSAFFSGVWTVSVSMTIFTPLEVPGPLMTVQVMPPAMIRRTRIPAAMKRPFLGTRLKKRPSELPVVTFFEGGACLLPSWDLEDASERFSTSRG